MNVLIVLLLILVLAAVALGAWGVTIYNNLVQVKRNVDQAWANIDVLLKQRHDEIPKLIDAVKGYMTYEKELLHNITSLRTLMVHVSLSVEICGMPSATSGMILSTLSAGSRR